MSCPICLEDMIAAGAGANITLDCNHEFHKICMDTWKAKSNACPLCRAAIESPDFPMIDWDAAVLITLPSSNPAVTFYVFPFRQ